MSSSQRYCFSHPSCSNLSLPASVGQMQPLVTNCSSSYFYRGEMAERPDKQQGTMTDEGFLSGLKPKQISAF